MEQRLAMINVSLKLMWLCQFCCIGGVLVRSRGAEKLEQKQINHPKEYVDLAVSVDLKTACVMLDQRDKLSKLKA